jgi:Flp pilus assembly protein TadD
MKKNNLLLFATILAAVVLSGCGGINKMKDNAKNIGYTVTPNPLEVKGGKVEVSVTGKFPPKYFNKNAVLVVTPTLTYQGGETPYKSISLQGEKIQGNEKVIKYAEGGSYTISDTVSYKKEMQVSALEVKIKASLKKKSVDIPGVKVADGVIATEMLVVKDPRSILLPDRFVRESTSQLVADIKYLMNRAEVRPAELKKDEIKNLNSTLKTIEADPKKTIKGIELSAYASPDGPMDLNENLAGKRKESANTYFSKDIIKKGKLTKVNDNIFSYLVTAEDWDGFKQLMEASNVKDKELVLRVLSMYSDPVVREKEIKNISEAFSEIKEKILPQLRRTKMTVNVVDPGKTDEEILALARSKPDSLSAEELIFAAGKLTNDLNEQLAFYQAAERKAPGDVRAKNNVGAILLKLNRTADAKAELEAAKQIEDNGAVKNNLGVIAFLEGDLAKALDLFTSAMGAGAEVNYNIGIIKIIQGKYSEAINSFGGAAEINAALAKLLNKDNEGALATLNSVKSEDALVYYLKAIVGARTQNADLLTTNLTTACSKSAELKANAPKDLEFMKYFQEASFKSIVQ